MVSLNGINPPLVEIENETRWNFSIKWEYGLVIILLLDLANEVRLTGNDFNNLVSVPGSNVFVQSQTGKTAEELTVREFSKIRFCLSRRSVTAVIYLPMHHASALTERRDRNLVAVSAESRILNPPRLAALCRDAATLYGRTFR